MHRNSFQDIVPSGKRKTIRDIKKPDDYGKKSSRHLYDDEYNSKKYSRFSKFGIWIIALIAIIIFVLAFSLLFSGATINITPKQNKVLIDARFEAQREAGIGELGYEVMTIEKEASKEVVATGREEVEEKASGKIIVYNDFNSSSQRLIKNTRFETPDGLIYRIDKSVTVPGKKEVDGEVVPGSIGATVYADESGDGYNIGLTDFTIPGFKGSPRFDKFYARSKTTMTGGFKGERLTANEDDINKARNALHEQLRNQLLNDAFSQKPEGFYLFEDAVFIEFESLPETEKRSNIEIKEKAVLYGMLFDSNQFAEHIAKNTIAGFDNEKVGIIDISGLELSVFSKENNKPWEENEFLFSLIGNAHIVWLYEEEKLKNDLAGRSKDALPTILSGYPSIEKADVILWPFWKRSFPEKTSKIKVERVLE